MAILKSRLSLLLICGALPAATTTQLEFIGFPHVTPGNMVVIGDSLGAGYQNFSLFDSTSVAPGTIPPVPPGGQKWGFAAQIANQAGVDLHLPLIAYPGLPPVLTLTQNGTLERGSVPGTREPQTLEIQTQDLSVPGFTVADTLSHSVSASAIANPATASPEDLLALQILGYPSLSNLANSCGVFPMPDGSITFSPLACALKLKPSVTIVSIGSNDVLGTVLYGTPPTDPAVFQAEYLQLLYSLKLSGTQVLVANIPDVTVAPVLQSYAQFEARCGVPPTGATPADYVVPDITNPNLSSLNVCTNYLVRSGALIAQTRQTVKQYNLIIDGAAASIRAPLVNLYGLLDEIASNGYRLNNGGVLTAQYLGGIFSLDGVHPTNTGYAIMANEFISVMDRDFHLLIPQVSVDQVAATDPLLVPAICPLLGPDGCFSVTTADPLK